MSRALFGRQEGWAPADSLQKQAKTDGPQTLFNPEKKFT
jgi:hypothetical protein